MEASTFVIGYDLIGYLKGNLSERTKSWISFRWTSQRREKSETKCWLYKKVHTMLLDRNITKAEVARHFDVSRPTLKNRFISNA